MRSPRTMLLLLCLPASLAALAAPVPDPATCRTLPAKPIPAEVMTDGFLEAHPDLRWRSIALGQYRDGRYAEALRSFKRAATYADKFSQSMVGRMHWQGEGTAVDRPLAYAWMDLASERMYHDFLRQREAYWAVMSAEERAQAVDRGQAVVAEYADRSAKPRMEKELRKGRDRITGSRVGYVSAGLYVVPNRGPYAGVEIPAQQVYPDAYWQPEHYWCTQDAYWSRPLNPDVNVGLPEQLPATPPGGG